MALFHSTARGIPLTMAGFAYGLNGVGYSRDMVSSGWCWISTDQPWGKIVMWMLVAGKGWEISYIAISVFYVLVKQEVSNYNSVSCTIPFLSPCNAEITSAYRKTNQFRKRTCTRKAKNSTDPNPGTLFGCASLVDSIAYLLAN